MMRDSFSAALERVTEFGNRSEHPRQSTPSLRSTASLRSPPFSLSPEARESILKDLEFLLAAEEAEEKEALYRRATRVRDERCGKRMVLRGLIEFSSYCGNTCRYCGLNRNNAKAERYRLSRGEILESARLVRDAGIRTVVLQSGEDGFSAASLADIINEIKELDDMAVTLSVGERSREDYELWKEAGADRYLIRVESSDPALYSSLHEGRSLETRIGCIDTLRELGYQTGSGFMVGPPGQTLAHIAGDILFLAERDFDMIGIGPFIPHPDTPFRDASAGTAELTLNAVACARIACGNAWIPATTALGSLDRDYRVDALRAGANVVMPNFSPAEVKKKYGIYPGKRCITENTGACANCMERLASLAGLELDRSRADTLKAR